MIQSRNRDIGIDLVKFIAIIGVVFIHTCNYSGAIGSFEWLSSLFWGSVTRGSVPLFIMSSGAIMYNSQKPLDIKKLYVKNILRLFVAMFVWSMAYKVYYLIAFDTFSMTTLIHSVKEIFLFKQEFHFYYIHMIIVFYVLLPIIRTLVHNSDKRQLQYMLAVWLVFAVIYPSLDTFWPFNMLGWTVPLWQLNMVYAAIGYGILGYYLKKYPLPVWSSIVLIIGGFAITFAGTYWCTLRDGYLQEEPFYSGMGIGATMLAIGIFTLANKVYVKNDKLRSVIVWGSLASFGIYLCHMLVMYILKYFIGFSVEFAHPIVSIPCMVAVVLAVSSAVYFVISKIPVLNKWIV